MLYSSVHPTQFFLPFCAARTSLFEPLVKELGKDLNRQNISLKLHGLDGGEPSFERLRADVVSYDFEASCPDAGVILVHGVEWFDVENKLRLSQFRTGPKLAVVDIKREC